MITANFGTLVKWTTGDALFCFQELNWCWGKLMMVAIKKLLFPSLLILIISSSVNSRGVKQFRSGKCSLVIKKSLKKIKLEENWNVTLSSTPVASAAWGGDKTSAGREQQSQEH